MTANSVSTYIDVDMDLCIRPLPFVLNVRFSKTLYLLASFRTKYSIKHMTAVAVLIVVSVLVFSASLITTSLVSAQNSRNRPLLTIGSENLVTIP